MAGVRYHGIERHEEVDVISRRDDGRSTRKKFLDAIGSPEGTLRVFGTLSLIAFLFSPVPFLAELVFFTALLIWLIGYSYKGRTWDLPFRVPRYLAEKGYKDRSTGALGEGLVYLGAARSSRTEKLEEVWATPGDTRTHRLVAGTTGSGKTEEMMGSIFNALMLNSGAVMIDGKASQQSFDSIYRICRLFGREEELFLINYIMGGRDIFDATATKMSNTYNPFSLGSSAMKAELMNGMLPDGKKDVWSERAVMFNAAVMPLLSFLAERGYVLFNPRLLVDFYNLDRIENLIWFGLLERHDGTVVDLRAEAPQDFARLQLDQVSGPIKLYVEQLPGYAMAKPKTANVLAPSSDQEIKTAIEEGPAAIAAWAERHAEAMARGSTPAPEAAGGARGPRRPTPQQNQGADAARAKVYEQHGYITMQLVRSTALLTFEYGHVFNVLEGEIDYRDLMLNRRIMYTALPSLERSPSSLGALGKLAVASIKSVLASLLDTPFEGFRREIIEGRPSNSEIPYNILCDEYGYYVVEGFAVAPAQARSFGVSITFGTQDLAALKKGDPNEAEATWENTNLRHAGRMTGGEESETYKKFSGAAGSAFVSSAMEMTHRRGKIGSKFDISAQSRAERVPRLNVNDLNGQQDGQFTLVVGTKTDASRGTQMAKEGGVRVVRYSAFFTGNVPKVPFYRLNHFVAVKPPTEQRIRQIAASQHMERALAGIREEDIEAFLELPENAGLKSGLADSVLTFLVARLAELPDDMTDEQVAAAGVAVVREFVQERMSALIADKVAQELAPIEECMRDVIDGAAIDDEDRALLGRVLDDLCNTLRSARVTEFAMQGDTARRVSQARRLLAA
ncbi:TraM recognition domain-containing protein [Xanthobacter aminoxidans]|uniref:TraM recognition domain-containing protein n=1 Tax=Xanthobacter aminoxidans TaxID=186280 RepID=A0ABW6ZNJ6_9HYPH